MCIYQGGDVPHFQLIKELLQKNKQEENVSGGGVVLDIGANQGFYTWYIATLGYDVHAFEIFEKNVIALQHGAEHNPPDVAKRVHIYPVGLGEQTGRMSMDGGHYEGRISKGGKNGPILTTSYDCFAYHNAPPLNNNNNNNQDNNSNNNNNGHLISNVAFVKLDVEGFEVAVLQGAKKSLFGPMGHVGGLLMEVGPFRWTRANVEYDTGVSEMKELSTHFKASYVIVRLSGGHATTCPESLREILSDQNPRIMQGVKVYKISSDNELEVILKKLYDIKGDCNFWYTN